MINPIYRVIDWTFNWVMTLIQLRIPLTQNIYITWLNIGFFFFALYLIFALLRLFGFHGSNILHKFYAPPGDRK